MCKKQVDVTCRSFYFVGVSVHLLSASKSMIVGPLRCATIAMGNLWSHCLSSVTENINHRPIMVLTVRLAPVVRDVFRSLWRLMKWCGVWTVWKFPVACWRSLSFGWSSA